MTPTRAKVLLGLAIPGTLLGTYIVWYATARGMYKPTDALQGALIGAFGGTVLALCIAALWRWWHGLAVGLVLAGAYTILIVRAAGRADDEAAAYAAWHARAEVFWPVCSGRGIPEAAPLAPLGRTPRPTVLITTPSEGAHYAWQGDPRWFPTSVAATQLVACLTTIANTLEVCGGSRARVRYRTTIEIHEARTGAVVAETTLTGDDPGPCPSSRPTRDAPRGIYGSMPSQAAELAFVRAQVQGLEAQ